MEIRKGIFAKDAQAGDIILISENIIPVLVKAVKKSEEDPTLTEVYNLGRTDDGLPILLQSGRIVGLLYRPRPEGKTEMDMLELVVKVLGEIIVDENEGARFGDGCSWDKLRDAYLPRLSKAIKEYELGKPLDEAAKPKIETSPRGYYYD